jgi:hypothetical protein
VSSIVETSCSSGLGVELISRIPDNGQELELLSRIPDDDIN